MAPACLRRHPFGTGRTAFCQRVASSVMTAGDDAVGAVPACGGRSDEEERRR
ncbi:putative methyltransferase [Mycobacterium tuberculosis]|nr:putative methyltransferase [Mycobacterium tuberculosis]